MYFLTPMCFICLKSKNDVDNFNTDILTKLHYCLEKREDFIPLSKRMKVCKDCLSKLNTAFHFKKMCFNNIIQFKDYVDQLGACNNCASYADIKINLIDVKRQKIINNINNNNLEVDESTDLILEQNLKAQLEIVKEELLDESCSESCGNDESKDQYLEEEWKLLTYNKDALEEYNAELGQCPKDSMTAYLFDKQFEKIFVKKEISDETYEITDFLGHYSNDGLELLHTEKILQDASIEELDNYPEKNLKYESFQYLEQSEIINNEKGHPYSCVICQKQFTTKTYLNEHMLTHNKTYNCGISIKSFAKKNYLKAHLSTHLKNEIQGDCSKGNAKKTKLLYDPKRRVFCSTCGRNFNCRSDLRRHMFIHTGQKPYCCLLCRKQFNRKCNLTRHLLNHHKQKICNQRPYCCSTCGKCFTLSSALESHMLAHINQQPNSYSVFAESYNQSSTPNNRTDSCLKDVQHQTEGPYCCSTCGIRFTNIALLEDHMLGSMCNKNFEVKSKLNQHMQCHSNEQQQRTPKTYICSTCGKHLTDSSSFRKHIFIHTGQEVHPCPICPRRFARKSNLDRHLLCHNMEESTLKDIQKTDDKRRFVCSTCSKYFISNSDLNRHTLIHTGQRPHSCSLCGKSFNQKGSLNRHMLCHSDERKHLCLICGKTYKERTILNKHMINHANEEQ